MGGGQRRLRGGGSRGHAGVHWGDRGQGWADVGCGGAQGVGGERGEHRGQEAGTSGAPAGAVRARVRLRRRWGLASATPLSMARTRAAGALSVCRGPRPTKGLRVKSRLLGAPAVGLQGAEMEGPGHRGPECSRPRSHCLPGLQSQSPPCHSRRQVRPDAAPASCGDPGSSRLRPGPRPWVTGGWTSTRQTWGAPIR